MMSTITIEEAQVKLLDLIHTLQPNEEVIITENNQPVARLTPVGERLLRVPGIAHGKVTDAFFAPLPEEELKVWEQ
jgi:antitoxin (DNA-binding transcriptional repressor) of toxin-antitoxin stability system